MSEWSAPRSLPGLIGQTKANEMILTGRFVDAAEAAAFARIYGCKIQSLLKEV